MASDQVTFVIGELDKFTESGLVALALDITGNLIEGTPIDIAWARSGWVPSISVPYTGGADLDPTPAKVASAQSIQKSGENELLTYRLSDGPLFVTNNVTYIEPLANGHSDQAPAGWVPDAIEKAVRQANK